MKKYHKITIFSLILLIIILNHNSYAIDFNLSNDNADTVLFESTAKLEFVSGKTTNIIGGFIFDPDNNNGIIDGIFQVDLRTLKTGIDLRDTHMKENHLETEKFPFAYLKISQVEGLPEKLLEDTAYKGKVIGEFYIHGVIKEISSDMIVLVKSKTGNNIAIKVKANFTIKLEDYDIPHPKALFMKIAKEIAVQVSITGLSNNAKAVIDLPQWDTKP